MKKDSLIDQTFGDYQLVKKLGQGAFGQIYRGNFTPTNEKRAVKLEPKDTRFPQLEYEYKLY
jgi:serine/threonine protein kinase